MSSSTPDVIDLFFDSQEISMCKHDMFRRLYGFLSLQEMLVENTLKECFTVYMSLDQFYISLCNEETYVVKNGLCTPYMLCLLYFRVFGEKALFDNLNKMQVAAVIREIEFYMSYKESNDMSCILMPLYDIMNSCYI